MDWTSILGGIMTGGASILDSILDKNAADEQRRSEEEKAEALNALNKQIADEANENERLIAQEANEANERIANATNQTNIDLANKANETNIALAEKANQTNIALNEATNKTNLDIAQQTNALNKAIADQNLNFQKQQQEYEEALQQQIFEREDTAYQRTVNDMRQAGMSPLAMNGTNNAGSVVSRTPQQNNMQYQGATMNSATVGNATVNPAQVSGYETVRPNYHTWQGVKAAALKSGTLDFMGAMNSVINTGLSVKSSLADIENQTAQTRLINAQADQLNATNPINQALLHLRYDSEKDTYEFNKSMYADQLSQFKDNQLYRNFWNKLGISTQENDIVKGMGLFFKGANATPFLNGAPSFDDYKTAIHSAYDTFKGFVKENESSLRKGSNLLKKTNKFGAVGTALDFLLGR